MISGILSKIKKSFVTGLLLILPLIVTLLILRFLFGIVTGLFSQVLLRFFPIMPIWLTTGFLEIVEKSQVVRCDMSVEDGIKMIMSGGILGPERICSPMKPTHSPQIQFSELDRQKGFGK
jgi:uncharacterized membrane protein